MADLIKRDKAIRSLKKMIDASAKGDIARFHNTIIENAIATLKSLSPAQPEDKWLVYYYADEEREYNTAECPVCGYIYDKSDTIWGEPFCPHCGQALNWGSEGRTG